MRFLFAFLLVAAVSVRAQTFIIEPVEVEPGFVAPGPLTVHPIGVLTLKEPGTYTAPSWTINGTLRLGTPGTYTVVASTGSVVISPSGSIRRLNTGNSIPIRITFRHADDFKFDSSNMDPAISITQGALPDIAPPPLINLSTRVTLAAGQTHTSGFVVAGRVQRQVLIRAIGPALRGFGVTNALATPVVTVFNNQQPLLTNAGWFVNPGLADTFGLVGAFPLPSDSRDAAMVAHLNPGSYTVQVGGGAGEVLLEIYFVQ